MASVLFENVNKKYSGEIKAVSNFSLEIKDGEFVVLLGPPGCGKSTILRMIAGLEEVGSGKIYIEDRLINDLKPQDRNIAMLFQNCTLYPRLSVYDNLAFGLKQRKYAKADIVQRVKKTAEVLEIESLLNKKPRVLSAGHKRRVAIGRAIVRDPKVFLMDEPLSNLDAKLRVQMRDEIIKLHRRLKTTIIYATQNQTEAMAMGGRIIVMCDGMIQQADEPIRIYERPANTFVARLIGTPEMNWISADLVCNESTIQLGFCEVEIKLPEKYLTDTMREYDGEKIILGIRAEDFVTDEHLIGQFSWSCFKVKVDAIDQLGMERYLNVTAGKNLKFIIRAGTKTDLPEIGSKITVAVDLDKIHLFDHDSGKTIFITN